MSDQLRMESERDFHNRRFAEDQEDIRAPLDKWYAALATASTNMNDLVRRYGQGADVLEYGCADGHITLINDHLADGARSLTGIDISDEAIGVARKTAAQCGASNCAFVVMDAENMAFPDASFDLVFGRGILHHLDLDKCYGEIARVLRPGGHAVFLEPLGHNPALNLIRKLTPQLRTPDEHPLLMRDLKAAQKWFPELECEFHGLTTPLATPFQKFPVGRPLMKMFEAADSVLLRIPLIRQNAWTVLLCAGVGAGASPGDRRAAAPA